MIKIVVDSSSDYTKDELKELNLKMVPLEVSIGGKHYYDGVDLDKDTFYELLISSQEFPKTSQPSPNEFLEVFEKAKADGDEVICILLSSCLSGTYQSALLAKQMSEYENIYIVDTLSATIGIRVLVNHAVKLLKEGKSAKEIAEKINSIKDRLRILAGVDTLEYLCKGGRVSKTAAAIGGIVNIKPVITVTKEGKVDVVAKKRGTLKALSYLEDTINSYNIDDDYDIFSVYTYGEENTAKLEERLSNIKITDRIQIGPTIGAHVGPGAFGIVFVEKV